MLTIPKPPPTLSPCLKVANASLAIDFYIRAFGATERYKLLDPTTGRVIHAELQIGESVLMLNELHAARNPQVSQSSGSFQLCLMVINVDVMVKSAEAAGATVTKRPADQFYGYRCANLVDPFGWEWMLAQRFEEITPQAMQERLNTVKKTSF